MVQPEPDALAEYRVGHQRTRFWLEWDRSNMNAYDLVIKFTSYAHYILHSLPIEKTRRGK